MTDPPEGKIADHGHGAPVPGSMPRVVRALLHYYAPDGHQPHHVYLGDAAALRSDLTSAQ